MKPPNAEGHPGEKVALTKSQLAAGDSSILPPDTVKEQRLASARQALNMKRILLANRLGLLDVDLCSPMDLVTLIDGVQALLADIADVCERQAIHSIGGAI